MALTLQNGQPLVQILLSVYDPGEHLVAQLESIRAQSYRPIYTLVRDDGSQSDSLERAMPELRRLGPHRFVRGAHLGAAKSFLSMLADLNSDAEYAAFCDQDDVWLPDKLSRAVHALSDVEGPAMYCGAVTLSGADLRPLGTHRTCERGPSFANALVQNIATGCTIVLNRSAADLAAKYLPTAAVMHDAWCYLLLSGTGTVVYDPEPRVLYRLHSSNTVGVHPARLAAWSARLRRHLGPPQGHWTAQALEMQAHFGSYLRPDARQALDDFIAASRSFPRRLSYAVRGQAHFQSRLDDVAFKILFTLRGA